MANLLYQPIVQHELVVSTVTIETEPMTDKVPQSSSLETLEDLENWEKMCLKFKM